MIGHSRDATAPATFFTRDLEFYQNNERVETFAQTMRDFRQMFAQPAAIRRELVPGTLEVYPIRNYGAMEVDRHRFCHAENGRDECGEFSFVHIWRRTRAGGGSRASSATDTSGPGFGGRSAICGSNRRPVERDISLAGAHGTSFWLLLQDLAQLKGTYRQSQSPAKEYGIGCRSHFHTARQSG